MQNFKIYNTVHCSAKEAEAISGKDGTVLVYVLKGWQGQRNWGGGAMGALAPQFYTFAHGRFVASHASPPNHISVPPPLKW